jgi:hypothetical protein
MRLRLCALWLCSLWLWLWLWLRTLRLAGRARVPVPARVLMRPVPVAARALMRPVPVSVLPALACACGCACDCACVRVCGSCTGRFGYSHDAIANCMQMCRLNFALGCVLGVLVLAAQVGPARAVYACTSDAGCAYEGCNDVSCACSSSDSNCVNGFWTGYSECNNGVWDAICVSTTYVTTTKQAETLCTVFPLFRIVLLWRVLESED